MNKIESLPKSIEVNNETYSVEVYVTAWDNLCIAYSSVMDDSNSLCSVVVEPKNKPLRIEDTLSFPLNNGIGNARTFDDAVDMIAEYIKKFQ